MNPKKRGGINVMEIDWRKKINQKIKQQYMTIAIMRHKVQAKAIKIFHFPNIVKGKKNLKIMSWIVVVCHVLHCITTKHEIG
jgi:hypothetical protein